LIPRPETELIVENALDILRGNENAFICEVGTGSGCIAVSILHEAKTAAAIGLDISEKALEVARRNAARHRVSERIELKTSDVFESLTDEKFDLIVSNPPYIPLNEVADLQAEVRDHEPHTALTDGLDGLSIVERIIREAPAFLKPEGFLLLEIGFGQAERVYEMFGAGKWEGLEFLKDLQGIPRTIKAKRTEKE
jgi:release factor glutamine methyltransferase